MKLFSIYDHKIKGYLKPFFDVHTGSALRAFEEACREASSPFAKFPSDFVLYELGTFNAETGEIKSYSPPIQLATPHQFIKSAAQPSAPELRTAKQFAKRMKEAQNDRTI